MPATAPPHRQQQQQQPTSSDMPKPETTNMWQNGGRPPPADDDDPDLKCPPHTTHRRLMTKIDLHVIPFLCLMYLLAFLDRVNIANAKLYHLREDLDMLDPPSRFNTAIVIFFVPYVLFEIPSNMLLKRFRPSTWLSLNMFLFGLTTMLQGVVRNYAGLLAARFFLGLFETGMFPGGEACFSTFGPMSSYISRYLLKMDMHSHAGPQGADCKISMLWNWYTIDACFLTPSWHITNEAMFAATCIGVVLLVMVVELTRRLGRAYDAFLVRQFRREAAAAARRREVDAEEEDAVLVVTFRATPLQQLARSVLHALTFGAAYVVMLLAMSFNGYVILCIFVGAGLGKFFCDWLEVRVGAGEGGDGARGMVEEPSVCCG
ncbi:hypothetical protein E4U41_004366 [Claviceps citrina]|nr:hypothetical protein E4U41_004366 [Claviceps citrina]